MSYRRESVWKTMDWWTVLIYIILVIAGWFSIYAATFDFDTVGMFDLSGRSGMQMVWIGTSLVLAFFIMLIEADWYEVFAFWIYILVIALLIVTIVVAPEIKGSRSWLVMGPIRLQPAEFAKFATALAIANIMNGYRFNLTQVNNFMKVVSLFLLPMLLILLQKETGSALVFLAFFLVLYREGMSGLILFIGFCAILFFVLAIRFDEAMWNLTPVGEFIVLSCILIIILGLLFNYKHGKHNLKLLVPIVVGVMAVAVIVSTLLYPFNLCWVAIALIAALAIYFILLFIKFRARRYLTIFVFAICAVGYLYSVDYVFDKILEPHQRIRIQVTLGVIDDPSGAGYNVNQSKIAIGSGGFTGKGYLNGTQTKLKYVPEQDTDFIFCTIGEEKGFIGTTAVLLLFVILILRLIFLAERQKTTFARVYGYCVASIIFFHVLVNIGMVIGITPVIGIPLPFFSYGGSSLWAFTILLFIFLRLDAARGDRL
ncbi:rod shape-determining protein RodA [Bacteroidales bacterium OttesenSCG-928-I14]|nr:rod shape-determining protein RodA [Bacteroidales bacterium OttesenSCG-928-I14]